MFRLSTCTIALGVAAVLFLLLHLQRTYRARHWIRKQRKAHLVSHSNNDIKITAEYVAAYARTSCVARTPPSC